jgi:vacuolar-type H+-ATPase subunit I/STV1
MFYRVAVAGMRVADVGEIPASAAITQPGRGKSIPATPAKVAKTPARASGVPPTPALQHSQHPQADLAAQVERLARQVGRIEVELEQTRAEIEDAQRNAESSEPSGQPWPALAESYATDVDSERGGRARDALLWTLRARAHSLALAEVVSRIETQAHNLAEVMRLLEDERQAADISADLAEELRETRLALRSAVPRRDLTIDELDEALKAHGFDVSTIVAQRNAAESSAQRTEAKLARERERQRQAMRFARERLGPEFSVELDAHLSAQRGVER